MNNFTDRKCCTSCPYKVEEE